MKKIGILLLSLLLLSSCSETVEKLKRIGKVPSLNHMELPPTETDPADELLYQARLEQQREHMRKTNSLWQPGSTTFFRDSRAWKIGDIIKVVVEIKGSAKLNNSTQQKRNGNDKLGLTSLFGKEKGISTFLSTKGDPASLIGTNSSRSHSGSGDISRKEDISTEIAAIVTKILPNGNLMIQGHQEVRVNFEVREVRVGGIIRPKDISSENSILSSQMAEARISYGGRGIVSDVQQPRPGSQVIEVLSPF